MPIEVIDSNSPPVVAVYCDKRNVMTKEKWHRTRLEKATKKEKIDFRKKKMTK